jgi:hypothetical protein
MWQWLCLLLSCTLLLGCQPECYEWKMDCWTRELKDGQIYVKTYPCCVGYWRGEYKP